MKKTLNKIKLVFFFYFYATFKYQNFQNTQQRFFLNSKTKIFQTLRKQVFKGIIITRQLQSRCLCFTGANYGCVSGPVSLTTKRAVKGSYLLSTSFLHLCPSCYPASRSLDGKGAKLNTIFQKLHWICYPTIVLPLRVTNESTSVISCISKIINRAKT